MLKLKVLRRAVCDAFATYAKASGGDVDVETARATFKHKLTKLEGGVVVASNGEVRLSKAK